ncbi:class 3 adenylate cyclase/tetratricopeptide (TPR) repeat protein [Bradyrhizobium elkanii]|uniref:ATP-binding protein n=1 Tax=Bradyrhizobium TaxID=374 RepID=UPI002167D5A0|nr:MULTISPECIES: adenylate/guanylate cyclase domain-containing protein [Bradyrhizobium]MCS3929173.1 class 3 adenylate cyclase/tetratricopeptide (TPR) repeat protein [Bradyrhizobium elkanii]MCS3969729.1 class 3 adenylate cyclase/tetratricopeptide (TPR) repeat protein [Bradyrhizobium japonicum]
MPFGVSKVSPVGASGQPSSRRSTRSGHRKGRSGKLPTERKYVTILRADLHQSTSLVVGLELEEAVNRLKPALQEMRDAVHSYGGIIYRELGDGMFAVFGAPVSDDLHAVMACLAALDLLRRIEALRDTAAKVRVGVHSGQVLAGSRSLDLSDTYELDGLPLIMAERLQSVAEPGQALSSEATRSLADGYIEFGPAVSYTLKGFPAAIPLHALLGVRETSKWRVSAARPRARFVGRDTEAARLIALAEGVSRQGCGANVAVIGEAGVGKSRLARECIEDLRARHWRVITTECSPILDEAPNSLMKAMFSEIAASLGAEAMKHLRDSFPSAQSAALDVMLREDGDDGSPDWGSLSPRARGKAIIAAARALVEHLAQTGPTVLLFEDLQWADAASSTAIQAILALAPQQPLLLIATVRSGGLPAWFDDACSEIVRLPALERTGGLAMLDQLLGSSAGLDGLKQRILDHTGCMPLFVEEVCRKLVENGTLIGEWGSFEAAAPVADLGVPPTVQGVIASRVDRLAPAAKFVLQVAAAIGPHVSTWLMRSVAALPEAAFRHALGTLLSAAMLVPASSAGAEADHDFAHELVRQVAHDAMTGPDRITLHARILAALEAAPKGGPRFAAALAHHALIAQAWDKAAEYAVAIARESFSQSALMDATRHYETAMYALDRLPPSHEREAKVIDLLIEARLAYSNIGKVSRWLNLAKEAEERSAAIGDELRRVAAMAVRAAALNFCGSPMDALEAGVQAVDQASRCGNAGWLAYAEYGLGQAYYVGGGYREATDQFHRAYQRFSVEGAMPPMGGSRVQASLLCCMMAGLCYVCLGDDPSAETEQYLADQIASLEARPLATIAASYSRAALLLHQGRQVDSEQALSQALDLARRHDVNLFVPVIACQQGLALLLLGRTNEARQALALAGAEADSLGHRSPRLRSDIYRSLADAVEPGGHDSAMQGVMALTQAARQQGYRPLELEALLLESALHRQAGDIDNSIRCSESAEGIAAMIGAKGTLRDFRKHLDQLVIVRPGHPNDQMVE